MKAMKHLFLGTDNLTQLCCLLKWGTSTITRSTTATQAGVDVGTGSVRASVVSETGQCCSSVTQEIGLWNPRADFYQQSSEDIWKWLSRAVELAISEAQVLPEDIKGIGFDATCSMVVLDEEFQPLSVSLDPSDDEKSEKCQNVILWMDHRAKEEVKVINSTGHQVLNAVGGTMSVEMQPPKLMWLKKNLPETWKKAKHFFDLPDFLSWRATSSLTRGMCSLVCKWSYYADSSSVKGWDESFFKQIGLEDLAEDDFSRIGIKELDVITTGHPAYEEAQRKAEESGMHLFDYLNDRIQKMSTKDDKHAAYLSTNFHVWPDFHGNRAPVADPNLRGMVSGLSLSSTVDDLAILYLATVQSLAYGTKHIISEMEKHGHKISWVYVCGGLRKNALYVQTHADVLGLRVILPDADDPVLLGAAMLGAQAHRKKGTLRDVMSAMGGGGTCLHPDNSVAKFHEKKYTVFMEMLKDQIKYRNLMAS